MIERYIQITCDACGEIEWSPECVSMSDFKANYIPAWRHRARKSLCPRCVESGVRWRDATLHDPR